MENITLFFLLLLGKDTTAFCNNAWHNPKQDSVYVFNKCEGTFITIEKEQMGTKNNALGNGLGDLSYEDVLLCDYITQRHMRYEDAVEEARGFNLVCHWEY